MSNEVQITNVSLPPKYLRAGERLMAQMTPDLQPWQRRQARRQLPDWFVGALVLFALFSPEVIAFSYIAIARAVTLQDGDLTMSNPTEIPGLPHQGDMAIDCGVAIEPMNQYWITIREGGQNKTIMVDGPSMLRFAEKARQTVGGNE